MIAELSISKVESNLYEYAISYGSQSLCTEGGFTSITDALRSAAEITGQISGYEVRYGGYCIGTFPIFGVAANTEQIAQAAIETAASFE